MFDMQYTPGFVMHFLNVYQQCLKELYDPCWLIALGLIRWLWRNCLEPSIN